MDGVDWLVTYTNEADGTEGRLSYRGEKPEVGSTMELPQETR